MNDHEPGIVAFARFTVRPTVEHAWPMAWQDLARIARTKAECDSFPVLTDLATSRCCAALSEWDNRRVLAGFGRENHILWIEEALDYAEIPTMVHVLAAIPSKNSGTVREYEWYESVRRGLTPAAW